MNVIDAFTAEMNMSEYVMKKYLADLSDAELLTRPAKGCNHLAWQLGHLITSENSLLNMICPGAGVDLPADFVKNHTPETAGSDDCALFMSKAEYFELFERVRTASKAAIARLSEADLDKASGMKRFPRVGDVVNLIANHIMMHVGQFVVVRRLLGKPVVI
jgi:hypothetical protein